MSTLTSTGSRTRSTHPPGWRSGRTALGSLALLSVVGALLVGSPLAPAASAASVQPATVVTLTFDDGNADQMTAVPIMNKYHMHGTFYIISGSVGAPNYVTRGNLLTIAQSGNEIGGHTVSHPDLTTVPAAEAQRQICNDRVTLSRWGFTPKSFAYPYAAYNSAVEAIVANCGYNSARSLGDIASAHGCSGCAVAGRIPPADPYSLAAVDEIDNTWSLQQMQAVVTKAQKGGGWVPFTFHHICSGSGCDSLSISPTTFSSFLSWLSTQPASTKVKTVNEVIGGATKPVVPGPPASGGTAVVNPSLETAGAPSFPQCWFPAGYGTNTTAWTRSSDAHTGSFSQRLDISGYSSGDAKLLPTFDLGGCSPAVTAGKTYTLSAFYKSSAVTQFSVYYRDSAGAWFYWTSSPWFATSPTWARASWTTPAAPVGATGVSFGLSLFNNGSLTTDDYAISTAGVATTLPAATTDLSAGIDLGAGTQDASLAPLAGYKPGSHPHHRTWSKGDRPFLPGGRTLRQGQRVAAPFPPD